MPWLTDLDVALRNGGIGFWADPGWRGRGHGPMSGVRAIIIHHTAGGGSNDWRVVRDGRAGLAGPLSQMTFERDGGVRLLAAGQSWHAGTGYHPRIGRNNGNAWCIGIEGVSRGVGNDWTSAQRREYPRVAAALCRHYGLPADAVIGHREWAPNRKIDPGDWDMNQFRAEVRRHLAGGHAPGPAPAPAAPLKPKVEPVIQNFPVVGNGALELNTPIKGASALYHTAYVSVRSTAGGGKVDVWWGMTGKGGRGEAHWTLNANERRWTELTTPDFADQTTIHYAFGAGVHGAITVEFAPK